MDFLNDVLETHTTRVKPVARQKSVPLRAILSENVPGIPLHSISGIPPSPSVLPSRSLAPTPTTETPILNPAPRVRFLWDAVRVHASFVELPNSTAI